MQLNKLLVISPYPSAAHPQTVTGVSVHAQNTVKSLQKYSKETSITVLSSGANDVPTQENDHGIPVYRLWEKDSFQTFITLAKTISQEFNDYKKVLIEFDFLIFGKPRYTAIFPFFILFLTLIGKDVTVIFHETPESIESKQYGMFHDIPKWQTSLTRIYVALLYRLIVSLSDHVIVLEDIIKEKLKSYGKARKISIIPGIVEEFKNIPTKKRSRKTLGISASSFVVLSFGYVSWYKGSDWIVNAIEDINRDLSRKKGKVNKKVELIIAGGENPDVRHDEAYQKYIKTLQNHAIEKGFTITGYIAPSLIPLYFQAADLVIFPYRTFSAGYGPLSLAYSFQKPFLLSYSMKSILRSQDIASILDSLKLPKENLYFMNEDFKKTLTKILRNEALRKKLAALSNKIQKERQGASIAARYFNELFT